MSSIQLARPPLRTSSRTMPPKNVIQRFASSRNLLWLLLVAVVLLYAFPFLYLVLTAFKPPTEVLAIPPTVLPKSWTIQNFHSALTTELVVPSLLNSVKTAVMSTALSLALAVPAAYGVMRYGTISGRLFIMAALITRMVPPVAIGVPLITTMRSLHLSDTSFGLALAHTTISLPLSVWLMASFFDAVPDELEEAARIDGCGRFSAIWRVVVPVVSGGIAVTAIFAFLASWNEFLFALLLTAVHAETAPIVIANFQTQFGLAWGPMTALAAVYSVPVVLLTLVLQRRIVAGLTLGAVKG